MHTDHLSYFNGIVELVQGTSRRVRVRQYVNIVSQMKGRLGRGSLAEA